jgi:S-formylglutathione hydrolase FrmB
VQVSIDSEASGFRHRPEWVYLPPAWFSRDRPALPVVMMIGGEFNTTADWIRAGQAAATLDAFATSHNGDVPVVVFADPSGAFATDTECVNGPRGNAADHLTKDVVPYIVSHFGVQASRWGVVGFSAGGTCALDLAVMHPATFSAFVDIAGDLRPNTGTTAQTIDRLFGGDAQAWASFDPITVMMRHGPYSDVSGVFVIPGQQEQRADAISAATLCTLGRVEHIVCTTESVEGRHNWPFAATAFERALPWLADQLRTPPR